MDMEQPRTDSLSGQKSMMDAKQSVDIEELTESATHATNFLKAIANKHRLMILCRLVMGPCSVNEFEKFLSARQSTVSQQLAILRHQGIVSTERVGKTIVYSLADENVIRQVELLYDIFCAGPKSKK